MAKVRLLSTLLLTLGVVGGGAKAAVIVPNSFVLSAPVPAVAGGALAQVDTSTHSFTGYDSSLAAVFTGSETSTVYSGDTANTFGGLTFVYNLSNDVSSKDAINRITLSGFTGVSADAGYVTGAGIVPVTLDRSADGNIIGFGFPGAEILQGTTTVKLVIRTNAAADLPDTMSISDGGTGTTGSFGPGKTPEPASLGILGLGALMMVRRKVRA